MKVHEIYDIQSISGAVGVRISETFIHDHNNVFMCKNLFIILCEYALLQFFLVFCQSIFRRQSYNIFHFHYFKLDDMLRFFAPCHKNMD